jgi:hypothetical protein
MSSRLTRVSRRAPFQVKEGAIANALVFSGRQPCWNVSGNILARSVGSFKKSRILPDIQKNPNIGPRKIWVTKKCSCQPRWIFARALSGAGSELQTTVDLICFDFHLYHVANLKRSPWNDVLSNFQIHHDVFDLLKGTGRGRGRSWWFWVADLFFSGFSDSFSFREIPG